MMSRIEISIVAPAYNEGGNIGKFVRECVKVIESLSMECEIVIVDDGSTDDTRMKLTELSKKYPRLRVVVHERNLGYRRSLLDAIENACGSFVLTIDSDLQYDVGMLPRFVEKMGEGYDVVSGVRILKEDSIARKMLSKGFTLLVNILFGSHFRDTNCIYRLFRKEAMKDIVLESEGFTLPTEQLIRWHHANANIGYVEVTQHGRTSGSSSFGLFSQIIAGIMVLFKLRTGY